MAKFLQETIRETGIKSPDKIKESEDFKEFFRKVRSPLLRPLSPADDELRSDPLAKVLPPTKSSKSPDCSRTTSPLTTSRARNSSPCAGPSSPPPLATQLIRAPTAT